MIFFKNAYLPSSPASLVILNFFDISLMTGSGSSVPNSPHVPQLINRKSSSRAGIAAIALWVSSVSYTHLDVYKRQNNEPQGQALQQAAEAFEAETGAKIKFEWKGRETKNILSSALEAQEKFDMFEDDYTRISKNYVNYVADLTDMAKAAGYADKSYAVFNNQATEWAGFLPCCLLYTSQFSRSHSGRSLKCSSSGSILPFQT